MSFYSLIILVWILKNVKNKKNKSQVGKQADKNVIF